MERLSCDLDTEALLTKLDILLLMLMKEYLKTTVDEAYDDGKHADGAEVDENFIVIKVDKEVEGVVFLFCIC